MKPFPPRAQIAFVIGAELDAISLGRYQVTLFFNNLGRITVEHVLEYMGHDATERHDIQKGMGAVRIHEVLAETVTRLDVEDWCLTLTFNSGRAFRILSIAGPLESGQIAIADKGFWVF